MPESSITRPPIRSGAATAVASEMLPPRLWPTSTGRSAPGRWATAHCAAGYLRRRRSPLGPEASVRAMDTVLRGATVVDGTGAPARRADVGLEAGRIAAVGTVDDTDGATVVGLDGLVLAPGFIDPHTHYDAQLLWDPDVTPSSWQGVTTVVVGNCGFGLAPTRPEHRPTIMRTLENVEGMPLAALEEGIRWEFESFPEYLDVLERTPTRANVAVLAGHTALRFFVMGEGATERTATVNEVARMRALLSEAMTSGA